jgi:hypothetical protein
VLRIQIRIDPHHIEMQDPDAHQRDHLDLDPDPHQLADDKPKMTATNMSSRVQFLL